MRKRILFTISVHARWASNTNITTYHTRRLTSISLGCVIHTSCFPARWASSIFPCLMNRWTIWDEPSNIPIYSMSVTKIGWKAWWKFLIKIVFLVTNWGAFLTPSGDTFAWHDPILNLGWFITSFVVMFIVVLVDIYLCCIFMVMPSIIYSNSSWMGKDVIGMLISLVFIYAWPNGRWWGYGGLQSYRKSTTCLNNIKFLKRVMICRNNFQISIMRRSLSYHSSLPYYHRHPLQYIARYELLLQIDVQEEMRL